MLYEQLHSCSLVVKRKEYKNGFFLSVSDLKVKDSITVVHCDGLSELTYKNESGHFTCNIYMNVLCNYFSEGNKRFMLQTARQIYAFFVEHSHNYASFNHFSVITDLTLCRDTGVVCHVEGY